MQVTMDLKLEMAKNGTGQYKLMELCKLNDVGKDKIWEIVKKKNSH